MKYLYGIPIIERKDVPKDTIYIMNRELPAIEFNIISSKKKRLSKTQTLKIKARFISDFEVRRLSKLKNI